MVPKGLKIGDTFDDGKRLYVVEAVNGNGTYFSRAVENGGPMANAGGERAEQSPAPTKRHTRSKKQPGNRQ